MRVWALEGSATLPRMPRSRRSAESAWTFWRIAGWTLLAAVCLGVVFLGIALAKAWRPMGKVAVGERRARMELSALFDDGHFVDVMPRQEPRLLQIIPKWLEPRGPYRRPQVTIPFVERAQADFFDPPQAGLRITWLGHSTLLVEIGGKRVLIDPVWGEHAAPLPLESLKRFFPPPLPFEELPKIDVVVISHDHYDHLDYPTISRLVEKDVPFFVPLGVGAHLEYWGVPPARIVEHEWWDETALDDELTLVCTPARHFSGRAPWDKDKTLWAGWALVGKEHRVFFSGDTALFPGFEEIGQRYGPFAATMIETGAYNQMWVDVHLGPEQAVKAHLMLRGKVMIPVHWGLFDLGLHGWTEPIERTLIQAKKSGVVVVTPRPGERVNPLEPQPVSRWWPQRPFEDAEKSPIMSSGL